jgi:hypothetical protein
LGGFQWNTDSTRQLFNSLKESRLVAISAPQLAKIKFFFDLSLNVFENKGQYSAKVC